MVSISTSKCTYELVHTAVVLLVDAWPAYHGTGSEMWHTHERSGDAAVSSNGLMTRTLTRTDRQPSQSVSQYVHLDIVYHTVPSEIFFEDILRSCAVASLHRHMTARISGADTLEGKNTSTEEGCSDMSWAIWALSINRQQQYTSSSSNTYTLCLVTGGGRISIIFQTLNRYKIS